MNDVAYSLERLGNILGRRRLRFNPYSVADSRLIEIVNSVGWGSRWDITEMVVVRVSRLREIVGAEGFNGIYITVGASAEEIPLGKGQLLYGILANDSGKQEYTLIGKRSVRKEEDIQRMVGKAYFVSRVIRGHDKYGNGRVAYRMNRLYGDQAKDAACIRTVMCDAKIEMLERILAYPENPDYLNCRKGLFDYGTPMRQTIDMIRRFPETPIPTS